MRSPFPGMDPYLEHPTLWPDVHNRLINALADALTPKVAPRYYIGLERRTYSLKPDDVVFIGRPDLAVIAHRPTPPPAALPLAEVGVLEVELPMNDEVNLNRPRSIMTAAAIALAVILMRYSFSAAQPAASG